jgi:hypothetical protein
LKKVCVRMELSLLITIFIYVGGKSKAGKYFK